MSCVADYRHVWVLLKMRRTLSLLLLLNDRLLPQWRQHQLSLRGYILPLNTPPLLHSKCLNVSNIHVRSQGSKTAIETSRNKLYRTVDPCFQYIMLLLLYPGRLLLSFILHALESPFVARLIILRHWYVLTWIWETCLYISVFRLFLVERDSYIYNYILVSANFLCVFQVISIENFCVNLCRIEPLYIRF